MITTSKKQLERRANLLNSLTKHSVNIDWDNWTNSIDVTVDGKTTTHKTLSSAYALLCETDRYYTHK